MNSKQRNLQIWINLYKYYNIIQGMTFGRVIKAFNLLHKFLLQHIPFSCYVISPWLHPSNILTCGLSFSPFFCLFQYCRLQIYKCKTFIHVFSNHSLSTCFSPGIVPGTGNNQTAYCLDRQMNKDRKYHVRDAVINIPLGEQRRE